ncbi:MAG: hypothetical protein JJT85_06635 [Chromatiales bacterium]|nr:hypothetical protein [Chromatiales bacterium]
MTPVRHLLLLALAAPLLSACASRQADVCIDQPQEYQDSRSIDPLRVPSDLARPSPAGALIIPDVPPPAPGATPPGCLDRPPEFIVPR